MNIVNWHQIYILVITYLQFTQLNAYIHLLGKDNGNNQPMFYKYVNKTSTATSYTYGEGSEKYCMYTCFQIFRSVCVAITFKEEDATPSCLYYKEHKALEDSVGGYYITIKKPSIQGICDNQVNQCGICDCFRTVDAARPYICDCRQHQAALDYYKTDCNETVVNNFTKSGIYTIQLDGIEKVDVMCGYDENGGIEVVIERAIGNTFPVDLHKYVEGYGWENGYMLGFNKLKNLTDIYCSTLRVEITTKDLNYAAAEYLSFKVTDSIQGQISYDTFHLMEGQMSNAIPKTDTFQNCEGGGFWWGNCDGNNLFHPTAIIWSTENLNYVKISLKRQDICLLSEGKPSESLTTYTVHTSSFAFDGKFDVFFATDKIITPWLKVDLREVFNINYIIIYHRLSGNSYVNKITDAKIQVSNNSFLDTNFHTCATFESPQKPIETFFCQKYTKGRYVRLIMGLSEGPTKWLNLMEMQCFGSK